MKRQCTCILTIARMHTHRRRNRDARFVSFEGGDVCSFVGWLVLSFVRSFVPSFVRPSVRASIRPSARWYWPCNWAQTLSSARPAKDYTPACPEGLEPNVLVWYIMLQIPVSDSRGEAGVNGVTFSLRARCCTTARYRRCLRQGTPTLS